MSSNFQTSISNASGGAELFVYQMIASTKSDKAKGVIQINHGMAEHGARYQRFATQLSNAGYHVVVHDHRGHGKTKASDAPLGVFAEKNGLQTALDDIRHINHLVSEQYPNLPVVLFGHSMGTILGFNYCLQYPQTIAAVALWNSGFDTGLLSVVFKLLLNIERMFKGSDVPSQLAQKMTFEDWNKKFAPNRTAFDWLSRDEAEVDKYVADPLCGFPVSIGMWLDVLAAINFGADDKNLSALPKQLPFHLQGGGDDPCSARGKAVARLAKRLEHAGLQNVSLNILPDTRHESLNELNRHEITTNFISWLDDNVCKPGNNSRQSI
ncbi:MAG: alpha/beta hydrolase [Hyphomicrobiales bacterium]|nr:alpha/beta hydrolase [Hyphomicrobiales bacterium]